MALELDGKRCAYGDCRSVRTVRCNECSHRREHDECWHLHFADIGEVAIAVVGQRSGMSLDGCGASPAEVRTSAWAMNVPGSEAVATDPSLSCAA